MDTLDALALRVRDGHYFGRGGIRSSHNHKPGVCYMAWDDNAGRERSTDLAPFWKPEVGAGIAGEIIGRGTYKAGDDVVPSLLLAHTVQRDVKGNVYRTGDVTVSLNRALLTALPERTTPHGTLVQITFKGKDDLMNGMHRYAVRIIDGDYLRDLLDKASAQ